MTAPLAPTTLRTLGGERTSKRAPVATLPAAQHAITRAREVETAAPLTTAPGLGPERAPLSQVLASLRERVEIAVREELEGTAWSAEACPWIPYWFEHYGAADAGKVEQVARR